MVLIIVHELGHFITGILLGLRVEKIEIYPYGGCSVFNHDINIRLYKEFLVLIMGPITQVIFVCMLEYFKMDVPSYFYSYHYFILMFNMLPIFPLDGGKILNILLCVLVSYYNSLKTTIYISYIFYICISVLIFILYRSLILILVMGLLFIKILKEIKRVDYYYQKFLLERHLNDYHFKRIKRIKDDRKMKRDYYHYFIYNSILIDEKKYLEEFYFS